MSNDPFNIPKRRIAKARKNVTDLIQHIQAYFNQSPFGRVTEPDETGAYQVHKIKVLQPIHDDLIDEAVSAAEELRSALDQAVYATVVAKGVKSRSVYFPIAKSEQDLDGVIKRGKDIPPDIADLCKSYRPYKGGHELLWGLSELRNGTTHRLLTPIGTTIGQAHMKHMRCPGLIKEMTFPPRWNSEKSELIVAIIGDDTHIEFDMQLGLYIALSGVETLEGRPAPETLSAMADEVEKIVLAIEEKCKSIT
ncbi:hypothetical protein [Paracidovorax wautersii]|uniref:hypothetical protein n=1 Tax=Paracidovorax wautersii TaxID=1177982 RepID=UPI0031DFA938